MQKIMRKLSFNIILFSDVHFGQRDLHKGKELKEEEIERQIEKFEKMLTNMIINHQKENKIDFIVFAGDIIEQELEDNSQKREYIYKFFEILSTVLEKYKVIDKEHVILVPGNHDQNFLTYFIRQCDRFGFTTGSLKEEIFEPKHKSFSPEYNVSFTLFNSGGKKKRVRKKKNHLLITLN